MPTWNPHPVFDYIVLTTIISPRQLDDAIIMSVLTFSRVEICEERMNCTRGRFASWRRRRSSSISSCVTAPAILPNSKTKTLTRTPPKKETRKKENPDKRKTPTTSAEKTKKPTKKYLPNQHKKTHEDFRLSTIVVVVVVVVSDFQNHQIPSVNLLQKHRNVKDGQLWKRELKPCREIEIAITLNPWAASKNMSLEPSTTWREP